MRNTFLIMNRNRFGFLGYLGYEKALFLFLVMSICFASSLPMGNAGQASSPDISASGSMMTSGDVCPTKEELIQKTRTLQMPFIANNGQVDDQVRFYARTFGGTVFVTKEGEIVYALPNNNSLESGIRRFESDSRMHNHRGQSPEGGTQDNLASCITEHASITPPIGLTGLNKLNVNRRDTVPVSHLPPMGLNGLNKLNVLNNYSLFNTLYAYLNTSNHPNPIPRSLALKETLVGANILGIAGEQPAATTVNYFTGNDKSKWKTNVPTYNQMSLGEVYKGIELNLKAYGNNVEKLFCVKPGASPGLIKVQLDGSKSLRVNQEGQLEVDTELGQVKFTRPIAYQEIEGKRVEVECRYMIADYGLRSAEGVKDLDFSLIPHSEFRNPHLEYGFTVAAYDKTKDLIIDPLLASTFLGGSDSDIGSFLTFDVSGNVYVTGYTYSTNFPTTSGAYDTSFNSSYGYDVFVSKLDRELTNLLASTYLGGSSDDYSFWLTLDTSGNVYVTGLTISTNFPITSGAYGTSNNGYYDVFVSKLDSELMSLLASTYLGGSNYDVGHSLILDSSGNVYVTGNTESTNFPTTNGAYNTSYNGGSYYFGGDVFVSKLDGGLTSLLASTYLGGSNDDYGYYLTLDISENVYVTGNTGSTDFSTTSGAYDTSFDGYGHDVFVSKLDSGLTSLLASTYLGGLNGDSIRSLTLDINGNVYVTGFTDSRDFPTTSGAYDTSFNGGFNDYDVFVSKLDGGLKSLLASTYLGGSNFRYPDLGEIILIPNRIPSANSYPEKWFPCCLI
ncbi:MAG: hypothetical protein HW390_2731, partial [Candidatus Brocadiaceae bacterium]|nr:hypothetical protein [Candidatus Brocadiaceae bacterium]